MNKAKVLVDGKPLEPASLPGDPEMGELGSSPSKAWQVAYSDIGMLILPGESSKQVAAMISHLRHRFRDQLATLVPFNVLNRNGTEDVIYLLPALFKGVFGEFVPPEEGPGGAFGPDFNSALQAAFERHGKRENPEVSPLEEGMVEAGPEQDGGTDES